MYKTLTSITTLGLAALFAACSSTEDPAGTGGTGNTTATGGASGSSGASGGTSGSTTGGAGGAATGGSGGAGGAGGAGAAGGSAGAGATSGTGGASGSAGLPGVGGAAGGMPAGGSAGAGGSEAGGQSGGAGVAGSAGAPPAPVLPPLVTSAPSAYWKTDAVPMDSTAAATVTVNMTEAQTWEGFGGSFNELGWNVLTTQALKDEALKLLYSAEDGAHFAWGRIPMGASDYATSRYTLDDTGTDVAPNSGEANRPPADTAMAMFSIARDEMSLIPYILAAKAARPDLRFWASPWTPPVWMKTGYKTENGGNSSAMATKPSYFDGGNMKNDSATLAAYAEYYKKFVEAYKAKGIEIEVVSPQNEPGYDQNYPSCLWDGATYATFVASHLGPKMMELGVKVMLGTMSNENLDITTATTVLANATAKGFLSVVGVQWGVLDKVKTGTTFSGLPIWATEHKCGNYPWNPSGYPAYNNTQAPNDQAYGVESWGYIKGAIVQGKVTAYNAWNMVLDKIGLGNDTSRDWKQNALLVADGGMIKPTPTYYVFRHLSQYVRPGAKVLGTTGGDAVAFKNPDGSIVAVMYNSGAANPAYVVDLGGKKLEFAMPGTGWATVMVKP